VAGENAAAVERRSERTIRLPVALRASRSMVVADATNLADALVDEITAG
jgi:hypothetical protein